MLQQAEIPFAHFRWTDGVILLTVILGAAANYYNTRERIRVVETKIEPIVRWWNRIAERRAEGLDLVREEHADRD